MAEGFFGRTITVEGKFAVAFEYRTGGESLSGWQLDELEDHARKQIWYAMRVGGKSGDLLATLDFPDFSEREFEGRWRIT